MKNLKKFAALLLAGAMALLMLTACGGGGGSVNNPEEQKVLNHISNQKGVQVTSDAQLREVAEKHLREDLEGALQLGNHKFFTKVHVEGEQEEYLTVTVTMNYIYSDTLLSSLLDAISKHVNTDINANVNQKGTWSKVGVVILSNSQQSYIGLSIRVKNPHKYPLIIILSPECGCKAALRGFFCACWQGEGLRPLFALRQNLLAVVQ